MNLKKVIVYYYFQVALVGQEPVLYARSVTENIRYGCTADVDNVQHAAKMANAHDFVMDTKEGYETNVGEKGSQMSGNNKHSNLNYK